MSASVGAVYTWEPRLAVAHRKYQQRLAALFGVGIEDIVLGPIEQHPHASTRQDMPYQEGTQQGAD